MKLQGDQLRLFTRLACGSWIALSIGCAPGSLATLLDETPGEDTPSPSPAETVTPPVSPSPTVTPPTATPPSTPTPVPSPVDLDGDGAYVPEDCNDGDDSIFPGATEVCDEKDNDCDGNIDEDFIKPSYYDDMDADGFGDTGTGIAYCSAPDGLVTVGGDCDDTNGLIYPGAPELCNEIDDNCNSDVDENKTQLYPDLDGDGFGDQDAPLQEACEDDPNVSPNNLDCEDTNSTIYPGAIEYCDSLDHNCNGTVSTEAVSYYSDADKDGYGDGSVAEIVACEPLKGYVDNGLDCLDSSNLTHPVQVDPVLGTSGGTGTFDSPLNSIQLAINRGDDCGLILLAPGQYNGFFSIDNRKTPLELRGTGGSAKTQLTANSATRPVTVSGSNGIKLNGLSVTSSFVGSQDGGCASVVSSDSVTLLDVSLSQCSVDSAKKGGGLNLSNASNVLLSRFSVVNSRASIGGGIHISDSSVTIDNATLSGNKADKNGAGLQAEQSAYPAISTRVVVKKSTFSSNQALDYGGGASAEAFVPMEFYDCRFEGNIAGGTYGGGIHNPSKVVRTIFISNRSTGTSNTSDGGALTVRQSSLVTNSIFMGNEAQYGGAINTYRYDADSRAVYRFYNNTFVDNNARSSLTPGDTFYFYTGDELDFSQNILIDIDGGNGDAFRTFDPSFDWTISYNFFFVSSGAIFAGLNSSITTDSIINNYGNKTDDVIARPFFVQYKSGEYAAADLHLKPDTICVDAGDPMAVPDLDGSAADMGAYGGPNALP